MLIIILITTRITIKVNKRIVDPKFMYICVCNAVTESDIHKAVEDGANCMHHLKSRLAVSTNCGSCHCEAKSCLEKALEKEMGSADLITY